MYLIFTDKSRTLYQSLRDIDFQVWAEVVLHKKTANRDSLKTGQIKTDSMQRSKVAVKKLDEVVSWLLREEGWGGEGR